MAPEEVQTVKRLLRNVFSDVLSLTDRVTSLEERGTQSSGKAFKALEVEGTIDLMAGTFVKKGETTERPSVMQSIPLLTTKLKFGTPMPNIVGETVLTASVKDQQVKLYKVLFRGDWLGNALKAVCCPVGGAGPDIVPTLNPNAGDGLSRLVKEGCPVHHECKDASAVGVGYTSGGNMIATGLFHQSRSVQEKLMSLTQAIVSPTENLTFGLFAAHAFDRIRDAAPGSASHASRTRMGTFSSASRDLFESVVDRQDSRRLRWSLGRFKFGSVGAWNVDDEYVLSGWVSLQNEENQRTVFGLDSCGVAVSTFPYANAPTHRMAFQMSSQGHRRSYAIECSSKQKLDNGLEVQPGIVGELDDRGFSIYLGIKTLLTF